MKFSEKWGDSIDSAVEYALADLGLTREEVTITVLEEPSKGFFGLGSKLAKVRVEAIEQEKQDIPEIIRPTVHSNHVEGEKAPVRTQKNNQESKPERKKENRKSKKEFKENNDIELGYGVVEGLNERPEDLVEQEEHPAKTFLQDVFKEMGLNISIKVSTNRNTVYIDIDGDDSGTVIGKRGQTLDAVQYLTSLVVNKGESDYIRVVIDAEGYREKREKTLERLANRLADKAVKTGKRVRLEPMNPYERKVIHTALQSRPEVTTKSEGEEPYRRVVIDPVRSK